MPIDLRRLHHSKENGSALRQEWIQGQQLRKAGTKQNLQDVHQRSVADAANALLERAFAMLEARNDASQQWQLFRARQKKRRSNRPSTVTDTAHDFAASINLKRLCAVHQQLLQQSLETAQQAHARALAQLPNYVDLELLENGSENNHLRNLLQQHANFSTDKNGSETAATVEAEDLNGSGSSPSYPQDPLFCLGGYAVLGGDDHALSNNQAVVLTDVGLNLQQALTRYAEDYWQSELEQLNINDGSHDSTPERLRRCELPARMELSVAALEEIWGSSRNGLAESASKLDNPSGPSSRNSPPSVSPPSTLVPSWMSLLHHEHDGKTYHDRQLPILHLITTKTAPCDSSSAPLAALAGSGSFSSFAGTCDSSFIVHGRREEDRDASWSTQPNGNKRSKKKNPTRPWYRRLMPESSAHRCFQVMALTGPSLNIDSRPVQLELVRKLLGFYESLLNFSAAAPSDFQQAAAPNVRVRALPAEQLLPAEASRLVVEGILPCNSRDHGQESFVCLGYVSNLLNYSSANIHHSTQRDRVHVITGTLCSIPETLEWIVQNGAAVAAAAAHGVSAATDHSPALPAGMQVPECLQSSGRLKPFVPYAKQILSNRHGKTWVEEIVTEVSTVAKGNDWKASGLGSSASRSKLTLDEIRHEALTCPFDFLPFHQL